MHDCPSCGGYCGCDGEDHDQATPDVCIHVCPADGDVDDDDLDDTAQYDYED